MKRRRVLQLGAVLGGGLLRAGELGRPLGPYGERSPFEKAVRWRRESKTPEAGSSFTPLADSYGILTPSALHYERHHGGVPAIDPARHRLILQGMVERPLILTVGEIKRLPSVSRIYVVECGGNSGGEWGAKTAPDVQRSHGLVSCSEWTGVPLKLLFEEVGVRAGASWIIAEGADAGRVQRSIPIAKAMDDMLLAYGQNGEALRPEQGYPLRLIVPGWEGATHIKWLQRIVVADQPYQSRDETSKYTDLMPDGKARQFTFVMEAKSVVTFPSGGQTLPGPGLYELTGLAWSGRGRIERVEVTSDGGRSWQAAQLQEPRLRLAWVRFRLPWRWDGKETVIASRSIDETGYVQPSREALTAVRGTNSGFHYNGIKLWKVGADGRVTNVEA
ncbi:MAG: sulfite dehydrogenase [Acidobacteria bacterium]|nr:sulfite dehydrogenase [Acidobacteriota bacterium]